MIRYVLDPSTRLIDGGAIVIGGSPLKLLRLRPVGTVAMRQLAATGERPAGATALVDRLLDSGMIHPAPRPGSGCRASDVTAVIPTFGTSPTQLEALVHAMHAEGVHGVVVVDDASPVPVPVSVAASALVLRLAANLGPGAARNRGGEVVETPAIAFLDSDTIPEPGWLAPLLDHFADPTTGLVAPRIVAAESAGGRLARFERWRSPLDLGPRRARIRSGSRVSYVPAAALVVRTEAFRSIGGFDESLRLGEDVDLVWRLDESGWRCRYEPDVRVGHRTRPTLRRWLRQRYDYGTSAAPLAARHPGALAPVRMNGWSAVAWTVGALVSPLAGLGIGVGTAGALARKLPPMAHPWREAYRLAGLGNLFAGRSLAAAMVRSWWPLALAACVVSRRARRVVAAAALVPAAIDLIRDPPHLDPVRAVVLCLADDVAYGAGVWVGALRGRSLEVLRPDFSKWPGATNDR